MISKNKMAFVRSLRYKKARDEERLYIIEGDKLVREYLQSGIAIKILIGKPEFINSLSPDLRSGIGELETAGYDELMKISSLKTPHNAIAVVPIPTREFDPDVVLNNLCVALDFVQDPGNLGTIIRAAAWFGIRHIICSENCVDVYNPKVIQASMGALLNVNVGYYDLRKLVAGAREKRVSVYGALLDGESIYSSKLGKKGIILLGNESKGISPELMPYITKKLVIPKFTSATIGIESLNVGMAAAIVFSEFAKAKIS